MVYNLTLLFDYPRYMGNPIQNFIAFNKEQMFEYIEKFANFKNIYISVYKFPNLTDKFSAVIDKIFFDFDDKTLVGDIPRCLIDTRKLHEKLMIDDIIHLIDKSGGGYHLFIFVEICDLNNKCDTIFNVQDYYERELDLKLDPKIKGDIRRIFRVPNTYNHSKEKYCVNINNEETLYSTQEEIDKYSEQPREIVFFGHKLLNIKNFDKERDYTRYNFNVNFNKDNVINDYNGALKELYNKSPDCVKYLIDKKELDYKERYFIILFIKETVINSRLPSFDDIIMLMKEILTEHKFNHFCYEEGLRTITSIMSKNYFIPLCKKIKSELKACPHLNSCGLQHPKYKY